ncbi:MAG: hypothetical protein U0073_01235 [Bacteroidia bacterium]
MKKLSTFNLMFILFCIALMVFIFMLVPHEGSMKSQSSDKYQNEYMEQHN